MSPNVAIVGMEKCADPQVTVGPDSETNQSCMFAAMFVLCSMHNSYFAAASDLVAGVAGALAVTVMIAGILAGYW